MSEVFATREQLEVLFRNIDGGVTVLAADGTFAYANETAARLIGFESPEALLSAGADAAVSGYALFRPSGTPLPREELPSRIALTTGAPVERTVHFRPADGGPDRISVVRAAPVLDAGGNVQYVVSFFREITEDRRRAARQAFIAEAGGLLGSSLDYEATLRTVASLAVPRLADLCTVDLIGAGRALERVASVYAEGAPRREQPASLDDTRGPGAVARTGERELATASVTVPIEARGRILGVITLGFASAGRQLDDDDVELVEDLARRAGIAIDNALLFRETRGSEAILDALFETAPVGLGFWDLDLRYVRVNDALAEINGIPVEEHIGRELRDVLPDLDEATYDVFRRVVETGEPVHDVEVFGATPAQPGVRRAWTGSYYPIRNADGELLGVGAVLAEVTDRLKAEQRARVQHAVTAIVAEADSLDDAIPRTLETIALVLEWDVGAYWPLTTGGPPECRYVFARTGFESFADATLGDEAVSLVGEIVAAGEPRWVGELSIGGEGLRSGFGFPAVVAGETVAILEFFSRDERASDEDLLAVVRALGRTVGQFVSRKRAEQEREEVLVAERRARADAEAAATMLAKLAAVTEVALAHLSLSDLLETLLERIAGVLDADTATILLLDEAESHLTVRASFGLGAEVERAIPIPLGEGFAGSVAASGESWLVHDLREVELVSPVLGARGITSIVAIPLIVENRVIGVLHAGAERAGAFGGDDAQLLELIADRVALAIRQVTLAAAEREAHERLTLLAEASALLVSSLRYEETLPQLAQLAVRRLADRCSIDLTAADGSVTRVAVAAADGLEFPADESSSERSLVAPLVARGRTLGAITLVRSEAGKPYDDADSALAHELAARAASAVDNAVLYQAATEGRERLGFLAEASALLASALDVDTALGRLGGLVVDRIADWCSIHLVDEQGSLRLVSLDHREVTAAAAARAYAELVEPQVDAPHGVPYVVRTGESELWREITPELLEAPVKGAGIHSAVIVPLRARGRTLGALTLVRAETGEPYTESDLEFAEDLGRRAGVAVDNAELYREAAERAQASRVLAAVGDGVLLVDRNGVVRYWNRAAAAITDIPPEAVVDRPLVEAIPGWLAVADRVPAVPEGVTMARAESLPLALPDRELWLSITGVAVADGVVYAFRDLTEDRALDTLKTEFVSTVSHELRTPLAAIYGAAMTLRRADVTLTDEQRTNLLGVISNEADRLARTVNDILWASRLDTGTLKVSIESCDPVELASSVIAAQRAHLPQGIEVHLAVEGAVPPVAADRDKVGQVLVNLVENAVKYSPDGGRVDLRLNAAGAQVRFAVADEGLGIPYSEQRRIFEKFYRLDPNMTRGIGGTGLGLYICRELVRRMNGRIWVESEPGRGSTFAFELPVAGGDPEVVAHMHALVRGGGLRRPRSSLRNR